MRQKKKYSSLAAIEQKPAATENAHAHPAAEHKFDGCSDCNPEKEEMQPSAHFKAAAADAPPAIPAVKGPAAWRQLWFAKTWKLRLFIGRLKCMLNQHDWEKTVCLDGQGEPRTEGGKLKPSDMMRCRRPECRVYRGAPTLLEVERWLQTDDFMVLARKDCPQCHGRGYARRMILDAETRAKLPCTCLRVQPIFVEYIPPKDRKEAKR